MCCVKKGMATASNIGTIFSVVSGLLLNPLPYPDSERIVQINESARGDRGGISGGGTFLEWQEHQQHFEVIAARHQMSHNFVGRGDGR